MRRKRARRAWRPVTRGLSLDAGELATTAQRAFDLRGTILELPRRAFFALTLRHCVLKLTCIACIAACRTIQGLHLARGATVAIFPPAVGLKESGGTLQAIELRLLVLIMPHSARDALYLVGEWVVLPLGTVFARRLPNRVLETPSNARSAGVRAAQPVRRLPSTARCATG